VATGHSLVAPCGLGNSKEAGGVQQGGGDETLSHANTGCNRAGWRNGSPGGGFLLLGYASGLSVKQHMCPCKQDGGWSPSAVQD